MRHQNYKYNIGSSPSHRKALLRNLAVEIITHRKIKTTHVKCKAIQAYVEKLITLAKEDSVHHRRLAFSKLNSKSAVGVLFAEIGPMFKSRNGGYTRIIKLADGRVGDNSKMSFISLVD